uniref:Uncharacterized protein n=1 Tax=Amphimedon queenslandica TaxID=400682 RepID=A0A1X7U5B3_AMPQE
MELCWNEYIADSEVAVGNMKQPEPDHCDKIKCLIEKKDREIRKFKEKTKEKDKEVKNIKEKKSQDEERKKEMSSKNDEILRWMRRYEECQMHCNYLEGERQRMKRRLNTLEAIERKRTKKEEEERKIKEEAMKRKVRINIEERRRFSDLAFSKIKKTMASTIAKNATALLATYTYHPPKENKTQ